MSESGYRFSRSTLSSSFGCAWISAWKRAAHSRQVGVVVRVPGPGGENSHADEGVESVVPEAAVVAVESAPAMAATMSPRVGRCGDRRQERPREQHGAKHGEPNATRSR